MTKFDTVKLNDHPGKTFMYCKRVLYGTPNQFRAQREYRSSTESVGSEQDWCLRARAYGLDGVVFDDFTQDTTLIVYFEEETYVHILHSEKRVLKGNYSSEGEIRGMRSEFESEFTRDKRTGKVEYHFSETERLKYKKKRG